MRPTYFGDSYDIVKRFLLGTLAPLGRWQVHPMFSEPHDPAFSAKFSKFLGAPLVGPEVFEHQKFLDDCKGAGHLLLDPDTGVRAGTPVASRSRRHHVYLSELVELARARPKSLTAVFDQSFPRGSTDVPLREKLGSLRRSRLSAFAYRSHASFLFVGASDAVVARARALLLGVGIPDERLV